MTAALAGLVRAARPGGPAVLVIPSWWGLTASFHAYARALAEAGIHAGLADLYGGATAATEAEARALRARPRRVPVYRHLLAALEDLARATGRERVGVAGFSMGGHWAVWLAQRPEAPIGAAVLYYAARAGDFGAARAPILAHFAARDAWVRPAARQRMEAAIRRAGRGYQAHDYPGTGHGFAESAAPGFDAEAARLALARDRAFLHDRLG